MVTIQQGDIWWADLQEPQGSAPGYYRPVVVVQRDEINRSQIQTVVCVTLSSNQRLVESPGNVFLPEHVTGLPKPSVANVSRVITIDKQFLAEYVATLPDHVVQKIIDGICFFLGQ